jgi:Tol biopolymer transport system component
MGGTGVAVKAPQMNDRAVSSRPGPPPPGWAADQTCHPAAASAAVAVVVAAGRVLAQRRARGLRRGLVLVVATAWLAGCTSGGRVSTATSATSPSGPPSAAPHRAGRIVFSTTDDIYVVNGDGSGLRQLTTGAAREFDPSWSPDGRRIAYRVESGPAAADIYVMNADGSGQRRLVSGLSPAWSPDGAWIAYGDDQGGISVMRPDGSASRRVPGTEQGEYPTWSPDGAKLAFMADRGGTSAANYEIYVINLDGTGRKRLTNSPGEDGWPAWSPDGSRIVFASQRDGCSVADPPHCLRRNGAAGDPVYSTLYVMHADGSGQQRVSKAFGMTADWSPDGRSLVFDDQIGLNVIRSDGSGRTRLPVDLDQPWLPDWIP